MLDLKDICFALTEMGVVEVVLEAGDAEEAPSIEFNGRDEKGDYFKITATNDDFLKTLKG